MKNRNNIYTVTLVAIAFAFAPILQAGQHLEGGPDPTLGTSAPVQAVITVHSTDNVTRGKTGSFVLVRSLGKIADADMSPALGFAGTYVNFKVSGTAIAGVDYVLLASPAYIGGSGYGLIQVKTLPDQRASAFRQALSVIVTLEPGAGYAIGAASSATMWIKPAVQSNQSSN
ncbi:MAG: hypothetical protein WA269_15565 [Candidatus Udaeobacter sp.]